MGRWRGGGGQETGRERRDMLLTRDIEFHIYSISFPLGLDQTHYVQCAVDMYSSITNTGSSTIAQGHTSTCTDSEGERLSLNMLSNESIFQPGVKLGVDVV